MSSGPRPRNPLWLQDKAVGSAIKPLPKSIKLWLREPSVYLDTQG
jgi:hypothetical protein